MFRNIILFEIRNRIRRPAIYLYFAAALIFTIFAFSTGSLPLGEKQHINSPFVIAMWCGGITMMMMLVSSSIMGDALYRDIEYNTKDYYLTYPVTKAGYFWGRYFGSFFCMLFIASAIIIGAYVGSKLGPAMGWKDIREYGPNLLGYYLHPFFTIALPNLFFTSSLFFGLVALTRNVKVIYSGGILLFLGYFLSVFFLGNTSNGTVINLADPFGLSGIRMVSASANSLQQNSSLFPVEGTFLLNRLLWSGVGFVILLYSYFRFNFERFFSGKRDKAAIEERAPGTKRSWNQKASIRFTGPYNRTTLFNLSKIELLNIVRDNYFWIIISAGVIFLGFVFWMGNAEFGVRNFPRTVMLFAIFNDIFPFFLFFIIIFYTGETLHRDRVTRYAFINDSLPPPNWVFNGSKLVALLILGAGLSFLPVVVALAVQLCKGFHRFNFPAYLTYLFLIILPRLLEMVIFSYMVHVVINNKFAAHAVGITFWVAVYFFHETRIFGYTMLLYGFTPNYGISDMDGLGHMTAAVNWFNAYWLLFGGLLVIVSALFYYRGVSSSFKERLQLFRERLDKKTKLFASVLLLAFLGTGAYVYYNVSYLNNFLSKSELEDRAAIYEKTLKRYQKLPLPKVTGIIMRVDLYPERQAAYTKALVTLCNKTTQPIAQLLLDADGLTDYSVKDAGADVRFSCPLVYHRGFFNVFRPAKDTSDFRLYHFQKPLNPGDSIVLEITSSVAPSGFSNDLYAANLLRNGTFFNGGLPSLGYDDDDELTSPYLRKKNSLVSKEETEIAQDDPEGTRTLKAGVAADLLYYDITISTSGDQTAIAPGELKAKWQQGGRNYFHYVQAKPGLYMPVAVASARYKIASDSVMLDRLVHVSVYYHPDHGTNVKRFMAGYKDGLKYYDSVYGHYPFTDMRLAETSVYGPRGASMTTVNTYAEYYGWNADFIDSNEFDYCYFNATRELAQQWWRFQVAPNNTIGSLVIPEGLASYSALVMAERKYGKDNIKAILQDQVWFYLFIRRKMEDKEHPLIKADKWFEWGGKASVALYGLRDLIGEDRMNAALRDFKNQYAFKSSPPFAGTKNLYDCLKKHVPDSLQYYLTDTWQKITLYDNKITGATATPTGNKDEYSVTLTVDVNKVWVDDKGNDIADTKMNDYLDIGIFAAPTTSGGGRTITNPLYFQKYKFTAGRHHITVLVKGKPVIAGIDPYAKLIDRQPNDNMKKMD